MVTARIFSHHNILNILNILIFSHHNIRNSIVCGVILFLLSSFKAAGRGSSEHVQPVNQQRLQWSLLLRPSQERHSSFKSRGPALPFQLLSNCIQGSGQSVQCGADFPFVSRRLVHKLGRQVHGALEESISLCQALLVLSD